MRQIEAGKQKRLERKTGEAPGMELCNKSQRPNKASTPWLLPIFSVQMQTQV